MYYDVTEVGSVDSWTERHKNMNDRLLDFVKKVEMGLEITHEKYFFFLFSL